jgi:hypothetical protein
MVRVRCEGQLSRARVFREGLPQGAVLSPILFITFIDDMLELFAEDTFVSAYADDLAIACTATDKREAEVKMRTEVRKVEGWSRRNGLQLNYKKCTTCLFTTDTGEYKWAPKVPLGDGNITEDRNPKFLGVTYDKQLTFGAHSEIVAKKMTSRTGLLKAVGGSDWGWDKQQLRQIYTATQRSTAEYASPAWAPWVSKTNLQKLDRAQLRAGRAISGLTMSTPSEAVLLEAGLEPLGQRYRKAALTTLDKWRHLGDGDPRRELAESRVPQRTKKKDWREAGAERLRRITEGVEGWDELAERETEREPPWRAGAP